MPRIKLNKDLVYAAGVDEGNRSMRKGGRKAWNEDDYNAAAREYNRLIVHILNPELREFIEKGG